jgi:heme oxygenase
MKAYLKLDFNFIVMIYYHYKHLKAAFKILNDQKIIVSRAENEMDKIDEIYEDIELDKNEKI